MEITDTYRHQGMRKQLVANLAEDLGKNRRPPITNRAVLNAIGKVPRHVFGGYNSALIEEIYKDKAMPIGEGQTISQPYTVARQSELLQIDPGMKVLEIGTGSGYQAAVLAEMGVHVYTIERHKKLYDRTRPILQELGYTKVRCFFGDGFEGLPAFAPFDRIIITAAVPELPKKLLQQLNVGGKIVLPFGTENNCTMLRVTKHADGQYETEEFGTFAFVPMLKGKVD